MFGGIYTKKRIIICAVCAVCVTVIAAVLITALYRGTAKPEEKPALPEAAAVKAPALLDTLTGDRDFSAHGSTADEADTDRQTPTYTPDTVPAVTGAGRIGESRDSMTVTWDEIDGVSGYRVYRRDMDKPDSEYKLFSTVKRPGLNIRNLSPGSLYGFKICAYYTDGGKSYSGEAQDFTCATVPTGAEGFTVTDQTKTTTDIEWNRIDRADGYSLKRCYGGEWSDYKTFDRDTTGFTDEELGGGKAYFYRICAYREDSFGRLYGGSADVFTVAGLLGPSDDGSSSKLGRVSLDYKKSSYADGYEIWYSRDKKSWEQLADTDKTHYSTSRLEDGETYYFRIYPYRYVSYLKVMGTYTELEFEAETMIYGKEVGDTYVEVSLSDQHMWYIVDGDVYLESDCVTGNYGSADTPKGFFNVNNKISPCTLKGDDYVSYVTYWMPFIGGGWGLHDASWRSRFGGSIYKGDGSHGCVNLPTDIAKKMYAHIEIGTPVVVY